MERGGDDEPRRTIRDALQTDARTRACNESFMDAGARGVSRQVRELRSGLAIPEAVAETPSADTARWRDRLHREACGRVRRRLAAAHTQRMGAEACRCAVTRCRGGRRARS